MKKLIIAAGFLVAGFAATLFTPSILFAQNTDTTIVKLDSITGVKTLIRYEDSGTGAGWAGNGPTLMKRTITKYTAHGKLIYQSLQVKKARGCVVELSAWDISGYDSSGAYKNLRYKKDAGWTELCDKDGGIILSNGLDAISLAQIQQVSWIDRADDY